MKHSKIHMESAPQSWRKFRSLASLHSHTLCSKETLAFINKLARNCTPIRLGLERGRKRYKEVHGTNLDLRRAWWTPPVAPRDAWLLEQDHIQSRFNANALVSLTDHDSIEAPLGLRVLEDCRELPISVEWTVPFGPTFFHLGIHNLPANSARELMSAMESFTASRKTLTLGSLLESISSHRETLVVFNHPCWDESGIGAQQHEQWAWHFASQYADFLHAFELNGLRPWPENRRALRMAQEAGKPIVSGGDRHALEPNTILDLTEALHFSQYVDQVRAGYTDLLVTDAYRENFQLRILQNLQDIMGPQEKHGRGWRDWSDRVFYLCDDGVVYPLSKLFSTRVPGVIQLFIKSLQLIRNRTVQRTVRSAFPRVEELAL